MNHQKSVLQRKTKSGISSLLGGAFQMRRAIAALCALSIALGCVGAGSGQAQQPERNLTMTRAQVEQVIRKFGPIMKLHPMEKYMMDDPEAVLNSGAVSLHWGIVKNEDDYNKFAREGTKQLPIRSAASLLAVVQQAQRDPRSKSNDFRYWMHIPNRLVRGNQTRAKALVKVRAQAKFIDVQFYFFYPYNGPGKFRVTVGNIVEEHVEMATAGRHYGDFEHVTLRLVPDQRSALPWRLVGVYLSRHGVSEWVRPSALTFERGNPVVYVARDSHANYPAVGNQHYMRPWSQSFGLGTAAVDLEDWTATGTSEPTNNSIAVATREQGTVIVVGSDRRLYKAWSLGEPFVLVKNSGNALSVATLKNGNVIVVGTDGRLWRALKLGSAFKPVPNTGNSVSVTALRDGRIVVVGTDGQLWVAPRLGSAFNPVPNTGNALSVTALKDGRIVVVGTDRHLWVAPRLGNAFSQVTRSGNATGVSALSDGRIVVTGTDGRLWVAPRLGAAFGKVSKTGTNFHTSRNYRIVSSNIPELAVQEPYWWRYSGRWGQHERLKFSYVIGAAGKSIYTYPFEEVGAGPHRPSGPTDDAVFVVVGTNGRLYSNPYGTTNFDEVANSGNARSVATLRDGRILVVGSDGQLWLAPKLGSAFRPVRNTGNARSVAALRDGRIVVTGTDGRLWVAPRLGAAYTPVANSSNARSVAALKDGTIVVVGSDGRLWSTPSLGAAFRPVAQSGNARSVAALKDGRIVVVGSDGGLWLSAGLGQPFSRVSHTANAVSVTGLP